MEMYWTIFSEEALLCAIKCFPDVKFIFVPSRCCINEKDYLFAQAATKFQHIIDL
jgi:hypothetical protein